MYWIFTGVIFVNLIGGDIKTDVIELRISSLLRK